MRLPRITDDDLAIEIAASAKCVRELQNPMGETAALLPPERIKRLLEAECRALAIALELQLRREGRDVGAELEAPDLLAIAHRWG